MGIMGEKLMGIMGIKGIMGETKGDNGGKLKGIMGEKLMGIMGGN